MMIVEALDVVAVHRSEHLNRFCGFCALDNKPFANALHHMDCLLQDDLTLKQPVCAPLRHFTGEADEQDHQEQRYGAYIEINDAHGFILQSRIVLAQRARISNDIRISFACPARLEFSICPAVTGDCCSL